MAPTPGRASILYREDHEPAHARFRARVQQKRDSEEEEGRQREAGSGLQGAPAPEELFAAIRNGDEQRAIAMMENEPALMRICHPVFEWTPLHVAAFALNAKLLAWMLDRGADVARRDRLDHTPLDIAARLSREKNADRFMAVATLLLARGAELTPCAAAARGDAAWLSDRAAEGTLVNPIEDDGGCVRVAVSHNRLDIVALLLDLGFDPDERTRFRAVGRDEVVFNWGMPLWECAAHQVSTRLRSCSSIEAPIRTPTCMQRNTGGGGVSPGRSTDDRVARAFRWCHRHLNSRWIRPC